MGDLDLFKRLREEHNDLFIRLNKQMYANLKSRNKNNNINPVYKGLIIDKCPIYVFTKIGAYKPYVKLIIDEIIYYTKENNTTLNFTTDFNLFKTTDKTTVSETLNKIIKIINEYNFNIILLYFTEDIFIVNNSDLTQLYALSIFIQLLKDICTYQVQDTARNYTNIYTIDVLIVIKEIEGLTKFDNAINYLKQPNIKPNATFDGFSFKSLEYLPNLWHDNPFVKILLFFLPKFMVIRNKNKLFVPDLYQKAHSNNKIFEVLVADLAPNSIIPTTGSQKLQTAQATNFLLNLDRILIELKLPVDFDITNATLVQNYIDTVFNNSLKLLIAFANVSYEYVKSFGIVIVFKYSNDVIIPVYNLETWASKDFNILFSVFTISFDNWKSNSNDIPSEKKQLLYLLGYQC